SVPARGGALVPTRPDASVPPPYGDPVAPPSGEVRDEHDTAADGRPELVAAPAEDGRPAWDADGSCRVHTLRRMGLDVPEGPYETVAGLVADLLGRIPTAGDRVELPGWHLSVHRVDRYRAEHVRIVRTDADAVPDAAPGSGSGSVPASGASPDPAAPSTGLLVAEGVR
ncbi:transporter associated domain-containing protein, partial [Streptomyces sp. NPDC006324]|uniref:transporter associated domain-containing protein n=1 Tax=Streptomyces sp. NPDC006324 TaxID=3156751 RepID=UPI0033A8EFB7